MMLIPISAMLNIGSLVLGFGAWAFGILAIRKKNSICHAHAVCSFSLCAVSMLLQLFEVQNRVNIGDYAAVEDTIGVVNIAAAVLVFVTIALNIAAFLKAGKQ